MKYSKYTTIKIIYQQQRRRHAPQDIVSDPDDESAHQAATRNRIVNTKVQYIAFIQTEQVLTFTRAIPTMFNNFLVSHFLTPTGDQSTSVDFIGF